MYHLKAKIYHEIRWTNSRRCAMLTLQISRVTQQVFEFLFGQDLQDLQNKRRRDELFWAPLDTCPWLNQPRSDQAVPIL